MQDIVADDFNALIDRLLAKSPALVRARQLLPAFDWRRAKSEQVDEMLSHLERAQMRVPRWLVEDLLASGHTIPVEMFASDARCLAFLATLNEPDVTREAACDIAHYLETIGSLDHIPRAALVQAITRLEMLGLKEAAARLALQAYAAAPQALRAIKARVDDHLAALPELAIRVSGTASTQMFASSLRYAFGAIGLQAVVKEGSHGAFIHELVEPDRSAEALLLLLDQNYFMPQDWRLDPQRFSSELDERVIMLAQAFKMYCDHSAGTLIVTTLPPASMPTAGHADGLFATGAARVQARVNAALADMASMNARICLIDTAQALGALPSQDHIDPKLWFYGRFAFSETATRHIAMAAARLWQSRSKGPAKVLALDFDNTLWGGVFGDDGIGALQCGDEFPGSAYKSFQAECLRLKSQGMLLVGLSKNNAEALDVFADHPGVVLKPDDFVAAAVDWKPKPENLRRIAADLGLGLDAFVFLDDSPHERAAMRRMCPEVHVPEMPADPASRPGWLRALACTWPARITSEDARRSDYYAAELKSRQLRAESATYDDYLAGLEQMLAVRPIDRVTLARVAQLHQRTNQFNLTNIRYSEADLSRGDGNGEKRLVYWGSVTDRFGDHGLVIAATIEIDGSNATIRSFVMSCRVIARMIEDAFLVALLSRLQEQGVRFVTGLFKPTAKNAVAAKLYSATGFHSTGVADGFETWVMDLKDVCLTMPRVVRTHWSNEQC